MITIELNEFSAEDAKMIEQLKKLGFSEETIQNAYYETMRRRREGLPQDRFEER